MFISEKNQHAIIVKVALLSGKDMHDLMAYRCALKTALVLLPRVPDDLT